MTQSLDFGNYDYWRSLTSVNLPEFKGVSVKLTYLRSDFDGWVENAGAGGNYGQRDREGYRAAIHWQSTDRLTANYVYDRGTQDGTANFFTSSLTRQDRSPPIDTPNRDDFSDTGHALTLAWDVTDHLLLKSVTSYRELESDALTDTAGAFFGVPIIGNFSMDQHQFSQEVLLSGEAPGLNVKYTTGALYFSESGRNLFGVNVFGFQTDPLGPTTPGLAENTSAGVYADVTWTPAVLENRLDLTAGGRLSFDDRRASGGVVV